MRVYKETNVEGFKVTVYHWNNKYLLKFENGWHEITYKISELDITSESDIDLFISDQDILTKVQESFIQLNNTVNAFLSKI